MTDNFNNQYPVKNIFISTSSFGKHSQEPLHLLEKEKINFELNQLGRTLNVEEIIKFLRNKDGLIAGTEPLNLLVFEKCPTLKVISRVGTGLDNIDLNAAAEKKVKVFNTPGGPTEAVAELTLGLILTLLRKINSLDGKIRQGIWKKEMGSLLSHKTVGIIGFGNIGKKLAELLRPFNCKILVYDPFVSCEGELFVKKVDSLDDLLSSADIVSLHMCYTKENYHILNRERFSKMKSTGILINAARGGLIDENALYNDLRKGKIAGAALDVFEKEPYQGNLKDIENVVLTPHIGSYATESRIQMEIDAVLNLLKGFGIN